MTYYLRFILFTEINQVSRAEGYRSGPEYLRGLGFNINAEGDFIVPAVATPTVLGNFIAVKNQEQQKRKEKQNRQQNQQHWRTYPGSSTQHRGPETFELISTLSKDRSRFIYM
uniref:Uncharacterized protein n=1 Tax=Panagrolaimus davidi TaxID=227884 RepID=A0A914QJ18_9BILA